MSYAESIKAVWPQIEKYMSELKDKQLEIEEKDRKLEKKKDRIYDLKEEIQTLEQKLERKRDKISKYKKMTTNISELIDGFDETDYW